MPANVNTGHIARNAASAGEYVWSDLSGDERNDFTGGPPDGRVDMTRFAVTADLTNLSFLVRLTNLDIPAGDGALQVQIAIDLDRLGSSGQPFLAGFADTQVSPAAEWEFLIMTRFGSGTLPSVWNASFEDVSGGAALAAADIGTDVVEVQVPWTILGLAGGPTGPIRFTVATFRSNSVDDTWDIVGLSDALDVLTNYGDPGAASNTFIEVQDSVIDYFFDVWFHLDPDLDPSAPVVVSEILYDGSQEWIEVFNRTGAPLAIESWLLGDEETIGGGEGMRFFPTGATLAPSEAAVIAASASGFMVANGFLPDYEFASTVGSVPDMVPAPTWATGTVVLSNTGDEVLLLDGMFTILDAATYEAGIYPGVTPHPGVVVDQSIERNVDFDTDNCAVDFSAQPTPTPGVPRSSLTSVPRQEAGAAPRLEPMSPNPASQAATIRFELPRPGAATVAIFDLEGRLVRRLLSGWMPAGAHSVRWEGRRDDGGLAASGVYIVRLDADGAGEARTLTLVR